MSGGNGTAHRTKEKGLDAQDPVASLGLGSDG